jgi:hypothetical protein
MNGEAWIVYCIVIFFFYGELYVLMHIIDVWTFVYAGI